MPIFIHQRVLANNEKKNFGRIINISSGGSVNCAKNFSAYSASKAALNTIAKSLNNEIDNFDIKINTLSPGLLKQKCFQKITLNQTCVYQHCCI